MQRTKSGFQILNIKYLIFNILLCVFAQWLDPRLLLADNTLAYLDNGVGARALGMAGAFVAVADNPSAVYWNVAGVAAQSDSQMELSYQQDNFDYQNMYLFATLPTTFGKLGFGAISNQASGIAGVPTANDGERPVASGSLSDAALTSFVSYSSIFRRGLYWGITGKYMTRTLASATASGIAADLGMMYFLNSNFIFGMQCRNAWSTGMKWQGTTSNPSDAVASAFFTGLTFKQEWYLLSLSWGLGGSSAIGGEYQPSKELRLRGGVQLPAGRIPGYWLGTTLDYTYFTLDYSFHIEGDATLGTGLEHTLSLGFKI